MSNPDAITTSADGPQVITASIAVPQSSPRTTARIVTDALAHIQQIGARHQRGERFPLHQFLESQKIFDALVELYTLHFEAKMHRIAQILDGELIPTTASPELYLARIYVSHWFLDLYAVNKAACDRHPLARCSDYYSQTIGIQSQSYDSYLTLLLNMIRPTYLHGTFRNALYIPVISNRYYWTSTTQDYFGIRGYTIRPKIFGALQRAMRASSENWQFDDVSSDANGRSFWLFDWHSDQAYTWFPAEGNFSRDDALVAFILGVPCTPPLAAKDRDALQQYPFNEDLSHYPYSFFERNHDRRFVGAIDSRTYETGTIRYPVTVPNPAAQTTGTPAETGQQPLTIGATAPGQSGEQPGAGQLALVPVSGPSPTTQTPAPQPQPFITEYHDVSVFYILDFKYYARVVNKIDMNMRAAAHKVLIFED